MLDLKTKITFDLIDSGRLSSKENMKIDKELFDNYKLKDRPKFRVYSWEDDSCTIGISQDFNKLSNLTKYKNSYAKRITGGGILMHDYNISYSLIIPSEFMQNLNVKKSYEKISIFLISFYNSLGMDVKYAKDEQNIALSHSDYCQVGFEPYDLIYMGKKIGGNAQRRNKHIIFQHGSIPIKSMKDKDIFGYSLEDFNINISVKKAKELLIESFKKSFNIDFI